MTATEEKLEGIANGSCMVVGGYEENCRNLCPIYGKGCNGFKTIFESFPGYFFSNLPPEIREAARKELEKIRGGNNGTI